jgi:hypothetical protein
MLPVTAPGQEAQANDDRADELRSRMYADREFMANIRRGYEEGLQGQGISVEAYIRNRWPNG